MSVKENSLHTIGVEFNSKVVRIGDKSVKLQVRRTFSWILLNFIVLLQEEQAAILSFSDTCLYFRYICLCLCNSARAVTLMACLLLCSSRYGIAQGRKGLNP